MKKKYFIIILSLVMMLLVSCSQPTNIEEPQKPAEIQEPAKEHLNEAAEPEPEEVTYDVVIVGGGSAGTTAALAAQSAGAKTLVVEKTGMLGGVAGNMAVGMLATESSLQKEADRIVYTGDMYNKLMEFNDYRSDGLLVKSILKASASTVDWLMENGLSLILGPTSDQYLHLSEEGIPINSTYHMFNGVMETYKNSDSDVDTSSITNNRFFGLYKNYLAQGGKILLNTRVYKLLTDDKGIAAGVICEKEDGTDLIVHAKSVVLCAGSYGGESDEFKEFSGLDIYESISMDNQGEGIEMAIDIGAHEWGTHSFMLHNSDSFSLADPTESIKDNDAWLLCNNSYAMWVNREGNRFANEQIGGDSALWANTTYSQGGVYYVIVDQAAVDDLIVNGTPTVVNIGEHYGAEYSMFNGAYIDRSNPPVSVTGELTGPIANLQNNLDELAKEGKIGKADTLEELAEQLSMNPEYLNNSAKQYNIAVENKDDAEFAKDSEYLTYTISKGPYYAIGVCTNTLGGTLGGVRVNDKLEVLNKKTGLPLPNLFAAGTNAGGYYGNNGSYPVYEGAACGFALVSGRLAGENAAKNALK